MPCPTLLGTEAVEKGYLEDAGFAINGGKGWSNVVFDNHQIDVTGNVAIAMGNYFFTSAADGSKTKVEYTFGYKKNADGKGAHLPPPLLSAIQSACSHQSAVPKLGDNFAANSGWSIDLISERPALVTSLVFFDADGDLKQLPGLVLCKSFIALFCTFEAF